VDIVRVDTIKLDGKAALTAGGEVSFKGQRGRFRFDHHAVVAGTDAGWLTVWGPVSGDGQKAQWRSFSVDAVRSVHRITKARSK